MKLKVHKIIIWPLNILLLIGFLQFGNNEIICIGENGHLEIETECLPCCNESDDVCLLDELNDLHDEHDNCNNCSDLILERQLWSKRFTKYSFIQPTKTLIPASFGTVNGLLFNKHIKINSNEPPLAFSKSFQSVFIDNTILRC